jgi:hypothetical protein
MITLYVILRLCVGSCTDGVDYYVAKQADSLLYSSIEDCQTAVTEFDGMKVSRSDGKPMSWHTTNYCGRVFFADYAQTERLLYGKVTCSYSTTMPESVMARLLDPYRTQIGVHACKEPKATN